MAKTAQPSLEVEVVPIGALTLDPRNARKHGRRNLEAIKGSLQQFGQRRPLVVRQDLQVIAGNGTLVAMRDLGFTEVAVTRVPADWTDDQVRAYALADNRTAELAEWDDAVLADMLAELDAGGWDLNSIGFDGLAEIAPGDADDEGPDVDEAAATAKPGDVWELGAHRFLCGSSTDADAVAALSASAGDLVLTDRHTASPTWRTRRRPPRFAGRRPASTGTSRTTHSRPTAWLSSCGMPWASRGRTRARAQAATSSTPTLAASSSRAPWPPAAGTSRRTSCGSRTLSCSARWTTTASTSPCSTAGSPAAGTPGTAGASGPLSWSTRSPTWTRSSATSSCRSCASATDPGRHPPRPAAAFRRASHMKPDGLLSRLIVNARKKGALVYDPFGFRVDAHRAGARGGYFCYGVDSSRYVDEVVRPADRDGSDREGAS